MMLKIIHRHTQKQWIEINLRNIVSSIQQIEEQHRGESGGKTNTEVQKIAERG